MKKKKTYIRPEIDVVSVESSQLLRNSEINDKPCADAKVHHHEDHHDMQDTWRVGYDSDWKQSKSIWDD